MTNIYYHQIIGEKNFETILVQGMKKNLFYFTSFNLFFQFISGNFFISNLIQNFKNQIRKQRSQVYKIRQL